MRVEDVVRSSLASRPIVDLLNGPVSALNGVTADQEAVLRSLGIGTIFDLAFTPVMRVARELAISADDPRTTFARHGRLPSQLVDPGLEVGPIADAGAGSLATLAFLDDATAALLTATLGVESVKDLGSWAPYRAAQDLVAHTYGSGTEVESLEAGSELVPRLGEYATEIAYYSRHVMVEGPTTDATELTGPVDITGAAILDGRPAIGALLTYKQTWTPQAITLGKLLHSLSLAPGETTKIAIIDFTSRARTSSSEQFSQSEALSNAVNQSSSVSQVASAVATEAQGGFSATGSTSTTVAGAALLGGPAIAGGAVTSTSAASVSGSAGRRTMDADFAQEISNATEQQSMSERVRKAALVTEASQEEREQITTRSVTNYNHMHALNVLYFEVVEVYQVRLALDKAERTIFVPMQLVKFDETTVLRFRSQLIRGALSTDIAAQLKRTSGATLAILQLPRSFDLPNPPPAEIPVSREELRRMAIERAKSASEVKTVFHAATKAGAVRLSDPRKYRSWEVDSDVELVNVGWSGIRISKVGIRREDGSTVDIDQNGGMRHPESVNAQIGVAISVVDLAEIGIEFSRSTAPEVQRLSLHLTTSLGTFFSVSCDCVLPAGKTTSRLVTFTTESTIGLIIEHLRDNALHYSQAIWRGLDAQTWGSLLGKFKFKGRALIEYADTTPIAVTGNYAVFKFPDDRSRAWSTWKSKKLVGTADVRSIVLPTGGVFAEAVLGRSNSAEKIDVTRFWNWQDSPIPIQAPDIAAIQAGGHAGITPGTPGSLDAPIVNILNPPPLPLTDGLGAILGAVSQPNIFRDMSGLAGTQQLAQAGLQVSGQAATGAISSLSEIVQAAIKAGVAVATGGASAIGGLGGSSPGGGQAALNLPAIGGNPVASGVERRVSPATENITNTGGILNQARGLDQAASTGANRTAEREVLRSVIPSGGAGASTNFLQPARPDGVDPTERGDSGAPTRGISLESAVAQVRELAGAGLGDAEFQQASSQLLRAAYVQAVRPLLSSAQNDGGQVTQATQAFLQMEAATQEFNLTGLAAELTEGRALLRQAITNALATENAGLGADGDIARVVRMDRLIGSAAAAGFDDVFDLGTLNASVRCTMSGLPDTIDEGQIVTVTITATQTLGGNGPVPLSGGRFVLTAGGGAPEQTFGTLDAAGVGSAQFSLSSGPIIGPGRPGSTEIAFFGAAISAQTALLSAEAAPVTVPGTLVIDYLGGRAPTAPTGTLDPSPFTLGSGDECIATVQVKQGTALLAGATVAFAVNGPGSISPAIQQTVRGESVVTYTAPAAGTGVAFIAATVQNDGQEATARYDIQII